MSRETWIALGATLLVFGGGFVGLRAWQDAEEAERRAAREARREEEREEGLEQLRELREESAGLIPDMLEGVALGMSLEEVRAIRATRMSPDSRPAEEGIEQWHERLPNGSEVMYGFDRALGLLLQVQVLSLLPDVTAIAPHLRAMNETYGVPSGIWDCPRTGDVPTRRFTWRQAETGVSDIFLIAGDRVSLTLYITTAQRTAYSLRRAGCRPVAREDLDAFPVSDHVPTPEGE